MSDMVSYLITAWEYCDVASEFTLNSRSLVNDQVLNNGNDNNNSNNEEYLNLTFEYLNFNSYNDYKLGKFVYKYEAFL